MKASKITLFAIFLSVFNILSFPSFAQKFEEISITEFESYIENLGTEVVKQFETGKKVALTSGKASRQKTWSVTGKAMGSVKIFQAGKIGGLTATLIINETGERFKTKYKLKRKNQWKKWEIVE